jgi:hypothetical protein
MIFGYTTSLGDDKQLVALVEAAVLVGSGKRCLFRVEAKKELTLMHAV